MSEKNPTEESAPTQVGHSPGPWSSRRAMVRTDGEYDYAITSDGIIIAEAFGRAGTAVYPSAEQNARLIAAAPDLLAACKLAVIALEDGVSDMSPGQIFDVLAAAINKSEGR